MTISISQTTVDANEKGKERMTTYDENRAALKLALEIRQLLYVKRTPGRQHQVKLLMEQLVTLLTTQTIENKGDDK